VITPAEVAAHHGLDGVGLTLEARQSVRRVYLDELRLAGKEIQMPHVDVNGCKLWYELKGWATTCSRSAEPFRARELRLRDRRDGAPLH
jgi:hypothetical protein